MLKASITIIFALLLTICASQSVSADVRLYRYDGNMPFVKMMLNMMVAMGIIDKIPAYSAYGWSGYPDSGLYGHNNLYSNNLYKRYLYSRNPYLRALALRGLSSGNTSNPLLRSPWLQSPWGHSGYNTMSPVWGSPDWGVLPTERYTYTPYGSRWSKHDLSGWVDEPWETSVWNPEAEAETSARSSKSNVPLVQNFNYNVPEKPPQHQKSPLHKLAPAERSRKQPESKAGPSTKAKKRSPLHKKVRQKPCITDFCGLKKPDLNGLWVAQEGEMLGINDERYLWTDGYSRYLRGQIKVQNEYLLTSVDDREEVLRFKYKLAGNNLLTLRPDGTMREFIRVPVYRYQDEYRYYNPGRGYQR
jgi:hypothetical protein